MLVVGVQRAVRSSPGDAELAEAHLRRDRHARELGEVELEDRDDDAGAARGAHSAARLDWRREHGDVEVGGPDLGRELRVVVQAWVGQDRERDGLGLPGPKACACSARSTASKQASGCFRDTARHSAGAKRSTASWSWARRTGTPRRATGRRSQSRRPIWARGCGP
jgi:hypothetical protein